THGDTSSSYLSRYKTPENTCYVLEDE
ncbi:hypothetical protein XELAEV_180005052mg, partial [Xenopus laevis]